MNTLAGQHAVVFGGGSGVGLATAKLLAAEGATVTIAGRDRAKLDAAIAGTKLTAHVADGRDLESIAALFERFDAFDHLVIPAGQTARGGRFLDDITDASFRETFDGKFWVQVNVLHAGARKVKPGGSITLFSGGAAHRALEGMVNIAAVNGALEAIVPPLALELAPTRVNVISPGTLRTTYWAGMPDDQLDQIMNRVAAGLPAGRVGTADDIARAALFLIASPFVTGSVLSVDGGLPHSKL